MKTWEEALLIIGLSTLVLLLMMGFAKTAGIFWDVSSLKSDVAELQKLTNDMKNDFHSRIYDLELDKKYPNKSLEYRVDSLDERFQNIEQRFQNALNTK